jgi:hypothetical protein
LVTSWEDWEKRRRGRAPRRKQKEILIAIMLLSANIIILSLRDAEKAMLL